MSTLLRLFLFVHYWYTGCWKTIPNGKHSRAYASRTLSALSGPERIGKSAHGLQGSPRWQVQTRYMSELGDNILRSFSLLFFPLQILYFWYPLSSTVPVSFYSYNMAKKKEKKTARPSYVTAPKRLTSLCYHYCKALQGAVKNFQEGKN